MTDDPRNTPGQKADEEEKAKAAGATAATGLGCLAAGLMPWTLLVVVALIILIAWIVRQAMIGYGQ